MTTTQEELAKRFGITPDELNVIVETMDHERGMVGPAEMSKGLAIVVKTYVDALSSAAERFTDASERQIADRLVALTIELLAGSLQATASTSN